MGIIFTATGWTGATITVVHVSLGTEVYTVADDLPGDALNAVDVATAFAAWLNAGSRGWSGPMTGVSWTVEDDGAGRDMFVVVPVGVSFTSMNGNAVAAQRIGIKNGSGGLAYGTTRGSCSAIPGTVMWDPRDVDRGPKNRVASYRMGHGLYSHRRPLVELPFDLVQAYAFGEAIRISAQPRTAYLYDEMGDQARLVTVGRHELGPGRQEDVTVVTGTLEVLGAP